MEYLEGHTLHRAIREAGHFPEERAAHVARQICRALREAHSLGVIHRDLKPANLFLVEHGDETDFVKILDFGLVKNVSDTKTEDLTQTGLFMGSPKYMAPEQIRGDRVDARTDIYALGIILYEMIAGKVPFDRPNSVNILMAHVNEEAPPIRQMNPNTQVSVAFEEVIARCMAKSPDNRFRSMDEVLAALKRIGNGAFSTGNGTGEFRVLSASGSAPRSLTPVGNDSGPAVELPGPGFGGSLPVPGGVVPNPPVSVSGGLSGSGSILAPLGMPETNDLSREVQFSSLPPNGGSKGILLSAVVGGLAILGIIGYAALRPSGAAAGSPPAPQIASALASSLASAVPVDTAPKAPSLVKVRINTDPDGATVKEDGVELCGSTPCDLLYKGADADPGREHKLTLTRQGYRPEARTLKIGDGPIAVKLTRAPEVPRFVPQAPTRPDTPPVPTGYKTDLPY